MDQAGDLLKISLSAAVPLWIQEMKGLPWPQISKIAGDAGSFIAAHGDALMYKTKGTTRDAFNHLARGLAALSFVPGGVTFAGMHFESRHEGGEETSGTNIPRNLTFEKGTLGRFILMRRLRLEWQEAPVPGYQSTKWPRGTRHYIVRIIDGKERELNTYFSKGAGLQGPPDIEEVLVSMGTDAADWERSRGSIEQYAAEPGADPEDPEAQYGQAAIETEAAGLRVFLGKQGYQELLEIVRKS